MTEEEFRANPPRPGDKVWIAPLEVESVHNASVVGLDSRGYRRTYYPADIDRIERAPRVPVVGDRVKLKWGLVPAVVIGIDDNVAWCKTVGAPDRYSARFCDLQVIEP